MRYGGPPEEPLRDIVTRLVDGAKAYARAEVNVVRQTVLAKVDQWRPAVVFLVVALLLVQAALTVAIGALGMALALWLGPAGGLAVAAVVGLAVAGLLAWIAIRRVTGGTA